MVVVDEDGANDATATPDVSFIFIMILKKSLKQKTIVPNNSKN